MVCKLLVSIALPLLVCGHAQQAPPAAQQRPQEAAFVPTITFSLDWDQADPSFFKIELDSSGRAAYTSKSAGQAEPFSQQFVFSNATRERILALARKADYFNGNLDSRQRHLAQTGLKTLTYNDASHSGTATYNWSPNASVQQLTDLFQAVSSTIETGRKLQALVEHDHLGLNQQLSEMEEAAEQRQMIEFGIIAPILREIASNPAFMDIARRRARHLLALVQR